MRQVLALTALSLWIAVRPCAAQARPLDSLAAAIAAGRFGNVHSMLIVHHGKALAEHYYKGADDAGRETMFDSATLHSMHSVTKSVTSLLVGIAIDRRAIAGVTQPLSAFFPGHAGALASTTIGDALSMRAGLAWNEWSYPYDDPRNDHLAMYAGGDVPGYILSRPREAPPGKRFVYSGGMSIVLAEAVRVATGLRADSLARAALFAPLGISAFHWETSRNGTVLAGGGLRLSPRDMAKLGQLVLHQGKWNGAQIVSESWIAESTRERVHSPPEGFPMWMLTGVWINRALGRWAPRADGYAYHWWLRDFKVGGSTYHSVSAEGRGGQFIFVLPELDAVAVFTGWNDNVRWSLPVLMMRSYVIPALRAQ